MIIILNKLKTLFQTYFTDGLYVGLTNKSDRVSTGVLKAGFATPHINIEYQNRIREAYATSGMDKIITNFEVHFLLKPSPELFINNEPRLNEITNQLNQFADIFLDKFIKDNKYDNEWFLMNQTISSIKQYNSQVFFITVNLNITNYEN